MHNFKTNNINLIKISILLKGSLQEILKGNLFYSGVLWSSKIRVCVCVCVCVCVWMLLVDS
jgi:hypothetical protein